mgnify:CR=1 FL=1
MVLAKHGTVVLSTSEIELDEDSWLSIPGRGHLTEGIHFVIIKPATLAALHLRAVRPARQCRPQNPACVEPITQWGSTASLDIKGNITGQFDQWKVMTQVAEF